MNVDTLVCPESRAGLTPASAADGWFAPEAEGYQPVGVTDTVLVRDDGGGCYPVVDGIPILLAPELLTRLETRRRVDVTVAPYAEAYNEMQHYSSTAATEATHASTSPHARRIARAAALGDELKAAFPEPAEVWLDARFDVAAQEAAYRHLHPVRDARVLQLGGRGAQAVMLLIAGAREAWVATPMVGELVYARALARHFQVEDRLHTVAAMAEELPFPDRRFDVVYSQGCVHHWVVERALRECARVLAAGGRFAAVEPWRGPLYGLGTKILGKRDTNVACEVLTAARITEPMSVFDGGRVEHHGALTRYPLLALSKAGYKVSQPLVRRIYRLDDLLSARIPRLQGAGSSVALLGWAPA